MVIKFIFWINVFVIFWAMIGYQISLRLLSKLLKDKENRKDTLYKPFVSVMIVAHNEEKVIKKKLENVIKNNYPKEKIEYIISLDYCTDRTEEIVNDFIQQHQETKIIIYTTNEHKGKTNAQNEAQKIAKGEILVMTDANSLFKENAISELVSSFSDDNIAYVTGRLSYINNKENDTASSESTYWENDLSQRLIESKIKTITAGNGAIYACRNNMYYDFPPIACHDSSMPYYYARKKLRAIYNPEAIAYEKAGEIMEDEFKRKVRMNRDIIKTLIRGVRCLNVFQYGWFSYFYFGHRMCRYLLWLAHILLFLTSVVLIKQHWIYVSVLVFQVIFYFIALICCVLKIDKNLICMTKYYCMTILAQWIGVINVITGKSKPIWEKAESTR